MKTIHDIKAMVGENRVEDALNALLDLIEEQDDTLVNQIILTKGRFKEYITNTNLGLEERDHIRQQIVNSILLLADDAEQYVKSVESATAPNLIPAFELSIKGNDEIIGLIYAHMYAYNTNDFKAMLPTLHPAYPEVKLTEWEEFLKKNAGENVGFQIVTIEPMAEALPSNGTPPTTVRYKMDYIRKSLISPPAFDSEWTSDIFTLMLTDDKRWKIVNDENIEFKILKGG